VLVVDDDAFSLTIAASALGAAGYPTRLFDSPQAFLQSNPYDRCGCVVLDMSMPGLSGLDVQRAIVEQGSSLSILFLTGTIDARGAIQAMKGGAVDILLKPVVLEELLSAVEAAVTRSLRTRASRQSHTAAQALWTGLSSREREVGLLVADGMLNKQISAELGLSEATVKIHRARAMAKLGVGSAAELSALIERLGVE